MSIDSESDIAANIQIGPITLGVVWAYIEAEEIKIAQELMVVAKPIAGGK